VLNSKDANGNYLYGGDKDNTPPLNVSTLSQLAALPSASDALSNGTLKKSVQVADGQSVQVGVLASDVGTQLMSVLKDVASFDAGTNGNFSATQNLTQPQMDFLTSEIPSSVTAAQQVNDGAATNGFTYKTLQAAADHQSSLST